MATEIQQCGYDPPSYNRKQIYKLNDLENKLLVALTEDGLPLKDREGNFEWDADITHPLGVDVRQVVEWKNWSKSGAGVCDLASDDINSVTNTKDAYIFDPTSTLLKCDISMYRPLKYFLDNTSYFSAEFGNGLNQIAVIGHGGGLRYTDGADSFHYSAKAVDIFWLGWATEQGPIAARPCNGAGEVLVSPTNHRRLVAVEAGLRKWFSYVLNRNIDKHHNHFHVDNGCAGIGLRKRPGSDKWVNTSCHYFAQDCIRAFTDVAVKYDGKWGNHTEKGFQTLLSDMGMDLLDPVTKVNHYLIFLDYIMMHGFADARAGQFRWDGDGTLQRSL